MPGWSVSDPAMPSAPRISGVSCDLQAVESACGRGLEMADLPVPCFLPQHGQNQREKTSGGENPLVCREPLPRIGGYGPRLRRHESAGCRRAHRRRPAPVSRRRLPVARRTSLAGSPAVLPETRTRRPARRHASTGSRSLPRRAAGEAHPAFAHGRPSRAESGGATPSRGSWAGAWRIPRGPRRSCRCPRTRPWRRRRATRRGSRCARRGSRPAA